jgi:hypothetical protein
MENIKIDLSEFSLEEILDAIKKICENHDEDGNLYIKRSDLNLYIKNPNQKEVLNLLSSLLK